EGIVRKYQKYPSYDYSKHITYYCTDYRISDINALEILSVYERSKKEKQTKKRDFTGYYVSKNGTTYLNGKILYHYGKIMNRSKRK
ncbi:MAG: hypothetical protein NC087_04840, partial [Anaeroplasma bactoclasticum]|nr:hypothetical protein [Anaeroplasma bactoclasticum]